MREDSKFLISLTVVLFLVFILSSGSEIKISFNSFLAKLDMSSKPEIIAGDGFGNSIALDKSENLSLSFIDEKQGLVFAKRIEGQWQRRVIDARAKAGNNTSLAFSKHGSANILYISDDFSLKIAKKEGDNWIIEKMAKNVALSCNLIFDIYGTAHISFWDSKESALKYGKFEAGVWKIETVDSWKIGWWNSLVLDSNQNPHISYYDFESQDLLYVYFDGGNWNKDTVDFKGDVGRFNSIVLDKKNKPHISYFDKSEGNLKYAVKGKGGWQSEAIDEKGVVGERTNIILGENENPVISYFCPIKGELKLARKIESRDWKIEVVDSGLKKDEGVDNSIILNKNKLSLAWQDLVSGQLKYLVD